jgi:hypothetical protein
MTIQEFPDFATEGLFFGKFRGIVRDNNDPLKLGRILAEVPAVPGMKTNWALPCVPYAGPQVGLFMLPPVEAMVWIEFEGGNPDHPIWSGCFWQQGEMLLPYERAPTAPANVKVLKTAFTTVVIDDSPETGEVSIVITPQAVTEYPVTMRFNTAGVELSTGLTKVTMVPQGSITASVADTTVVMTQESITATSPTITAVAAPSTVEMNSEGIGIQAPALAATVEGITALNSGQVTVNATQTEIDSLLNVLGEANFSLLATFEGAVNITGALAVEGGANIAGGLAVEGGANIAGGLAIEGGGVIDGVPII